MATFHTSTLLATDLPAACAAMVDADVTTAKYESLGNTDVHVETTAEGHGHPIHARRKVTVDLPVSGQRSCPPTTCTTQVDTWAPAAGGHDGRSEITVGARRCTSGGS